jgi:hypothetical protein
MTATTLRYPAAVATRSSRWLALSAWVICIGLASGFSCIGVRFLLPGIAVDPRPTQRDIASRRGSAFAVAQNAYTGLRWAVGHARVEGGPPLFRAG